MNESLKFSFYVFVSPKKPSKFAKLRIFLRNVFATTIGFVAKAGIIERGTNMKWRIIFSAGHLIFPMGGDNDVRSFQMVLLFNVVFFYYIISILFIVKNNPVNGVFLTFFLLYFVSSKIFLCLGKFYVFAKNRVVLL